MALFELNLLHTVEFVDIYAQPHIVISDATHYSDVNPKGAVPALLLDSGELLTEVGVILQYLCDLKPGSDLCPEQGTLGRYRVMEWLSYVGSDVHKTMGPLFNPHMPAAAKDLHRQNLNRRLAYIDQQLIDEPYLTGARFTVADAYLFVMMGWEPYFKFDFSAFANLVEFHRRVLERPSFARLLERNRPAMEGLKLPDFR